MKLNKALFLDRDGVVNVEKDYVHKIKDFEFMDGIFELALFFQEKSYIIIIITNQAGIGRGYYTEEDFYKLNEWMISEFAKNDIKISKVYFCPYHPEHGIDGYKKDSYDRKPNPGMILNAKEEFNLDLENSLLIGDKLSDIQAGLNAGIGTNMLLGKIEDINNHQFENIVRFNNLDYIVKYIKRRTLLV